jgi:hypothetical protein
MSIVISNRSYRNLIKLWGELVKTFLREVSHPDPKPAILAQAREFLKDNGIKLDPRTGTLKGTLKRLNYEAKEALSMPFHGEN